MLFSTILPFLATPVGKKFQYCCFLHLVKFFCKNIKWRSIFYTLSSFRGPCYIYRLSYMIVVGGEVISNSSPISWSVLQLRYMYTGDPSPLSVAHDACASKKKRLELNGLLNKLKILLLWWARLIFYHTHITKFYEMFVV